MASRMQKSSKMSSSSEVCVCGDPKLQRALPFSERRGAGGTDETGTNKDAHQMPVKQWRTLHCVPAICDLLHSTSCALFSIFIIAVHGTPQCGSERVHRYKVQGDSWLFSLLKDSKAIQTH